MFLHVSLTRIEVWTNIVAEEREEDEFNMARSLILNHNSVPAHSFCFCEV
jgi:hypothetical protein